SDAPSCRSRFALAIADIRRVEETPSHAAIGGHERIVRGEHDALGSDDLQRPLQVALTENASGSEVYVASHVLRHRALEPRDRCQPVDTVEVERNHLTPVPHDQLKSGEAVENSGEYQAE